MEGVLINLCVLLFSSLKGKTQKFKASNYSTSKTQVLTVKCFSEKGIDDKSPQVSITHNCMKYKHKFL